MNTFDNSENAQFIETILMRGLIGAQDKDIYLVIYDLSGRVLFITNKFANLFGFGNWRMLVGIFWLIMFITGCSGSSGNNYVGGSGSSRSWY